MKERFWDNNIHYLIDPFPNTIWHRSGGGWVRIEWDYPNETGSEIIRIERDCKPSNFNHIAQHGDSDSGYICVECRHCYKLGQRTVINCH